MSLAYFIAKRHFQSQRRKGFLSFITVIAIVGVMLGTAALIITLSVLDGFEREIKEKVIGFTSHIQVQGYRNQPLSHSVELLQKVQTTLHNIESISPFAAREGMIRFKENVDGIYLKGIDAGGNVITARQHIVDGQFLSEQASNSPQLFIGKKLADRLQASVGDKVVVFALTQRALAAVQPKARVFQVVGIYESGMAEYDDVYAYTRLADAQDLFELGNAVTGYDVMVHDINTIEPTAQQAEDILGYPAYARTVFQLYRNLFSWVELQKSLSPILLSLIIVVATVNIVGTLLMFVLEKTRAIGILRTLGASSSLIKRTFTLQGLLIAAVGIFLGNLLALGVCWLQLEFSIISIPAEIYYMNTVPILLRPLNFIIVTVVAFILCLITTLLPSRAAAKLDPVEALRFG